MVVIILVLRNVPSSPNRRTGKNLDLSGELHICEYTSNVRTRKLNIYVKEMQTLTLVENLTGAQQTYRKFCNRGPTDLSIIL